MTEAEVAADREFAAWMRENLHRAAERFGVSVVSAGGRSPQTPRKTTPNANTARRPAVSVSNRERNQAIRT